MNKKKTVKKVSKSPYQEREHQNFMIIVGGGFVIISVVVLLTNNFSVFLRTQPPATAVQGASTVLPSLTVTP